MKYSKQQSSKARTTMAKVVPLNNTLNVERQYANAFTVPNRYATLAKLQGGELGFYQTKIIPFTPKRLVAIQLIEKEAKLIKLSVANH